ncbi:MAG: acylphosphatase [Candidatus Nealsonbacteria bacterium]|nr:acylphosphatase [Candidatus Nealsonbacteria bacterium]
MKARVHIFVSGRVQGVLFRYTANIRANKLLIKGWIRNLKDGRVEAVFEGEKENIEKMLEWARIGPFFAKVEKIDIEWQEHKGEFNNFKTERGSQ